ncbi:MAG: hypothetical protein EPN85_04600 [Bacteroidetes bacterium]|nr:MAG: hypothetical protein EPN85_04600 [Bacteroidota bacterium]
MCFSAGASFGAAAALAVIGIISVRKIQEPKQLIFASIPLLFSIQQCAEGFVWLSLTNPAYAGFEKNATLIFLVFAQIVWPFQVPLALFLLEKPVGRKKILLFLSCMGLAVALFRIYWLSSYAAQATVIVHHISYSVEYINVITNYGVVFYFFATVFPSFFSSIKGMWYMGFAVLSSFIFALVFFPESLASVWCFFAAIISAAIFYIMRELQTTTSTKNEVLVPLNKF